MERELLLLGLLRRQEMHGYQLNEFINREMAFCADLKKPTAYYLLDKMAVAGWVSRTEEREGNRPTRQVYAITPEGEAAFRRLLRENLAGYSSAAFVDDVGLAFLDELPPAEAESLLQERRAALVEALAEAEAVPRHEGSSQLVVEHRVRHLRAELDWLDDVIARLS